MSQARHGRRGAVFSVRLTDEERATIEAEQAKGGGPRTMGAWLRWRALEPVLPGPGPGSTSAANDAPHRRGTTGAVALSAGAGNTSSRVILDLCAGSGAWSAPYEEAGYHVVKVTLPEGDVRTFRPPSKVWGVLCAPPCTEFSLAKGAGPRDFVRGMETVNACLRVVQQCSPRWWALENPVGFLRRFLGDPADAWEPCDFGDPWTKRTAIWGRFNRPRRGPWVKPTGSAMDRSTAAERAITPPGFARAFFEANP